MVKNGAHISRYLIQSMMQYRSHTAPHSFIKKHWSHSLSFESILHLLNIAADRMGYKEVEWSKNSDDGSVFRQWLMDKKSLGGRTRVDWEVIREMFEKYGFIPFCPKVRLLVFDIETGILTRRQRTHLSLTFRWHCHTNLACCL
jgi:hypothetical protein